MGFWAGGKITKAQARHNSWCLETYYPQFIYDRKPKRKRKAKQKAKRKGPK